MENEEVDSGFEAELDDEEIWYSDDPVAIPQINWFAKFRSFSPIVTLLIVTTFFLPNTVGGKVTLNSGSSIYEFGRGVAKTFPCSNSNNLTITPKSQFTNTANASGIHYFKSITFAGIPSSCIGVDFIVSAFNTSNSNPLALYNVNNSIAYVSMDPGPVFSAGLNSKGLTIQTNSPVSGFYSFTLSFDNPVANAEQVYKVTVQTSTHRIWSCALGGPCSVGDLGPGGGTVFYSNSSGFNCGPNFDSTGGPGGGKCNYLEYAASDWAGAGSSNRLMYWSYASDATYSFSNDVGMRSSWSSLVIGEGLQRTTINSSATGICSQPLTIPSSVSSSTPCKNAGAATLAYRGGEKSDWYLPNMSELNQLCKYINGKTWTSDSTACTYSSPIDPSFSDGTALWSSNAQGGNQIYQYSFSTLITGATARSQFRGTRPIRAF